MVAPCTRQKLPVPAPAQQLYTGAQQRLVREGLALLPPGRMDLVIVSPHYGLLQAEAVVAPYDVTWKGRPPAAVLAGARRLRITDRLLELAAPYPRVLVLLSATYLRPLELRERLTAPLRPGQEWTFFAPDGARRWLPAGAHVRVVPAGTDAARALGCITLAARAHLFRDFCRALAGG